MKMDNANNAIVHVKNANKIKINAYLVSNTSKFYLFIFNF